MLVEAGTVAFAQEPASPVARRASTQNLSREQLDNSVAPVTLSQGSLLIQVLVATYPLQGESSASPDASLGGAEVLTMTSVRALILFILTGGLQLPRTGRRHGTRMRTALFF